MSRPHKQHQGWGAGDDTLLERRDINADAPPGVGGERVNGAIEGAPRRRRMTGPFVTPGCSGGASRARRAHEQAT